MYPILCYKPQTNESEHPSILRKSLSSYSVRNLHLTVKKFLLVSSYRMAQTNGNYRPHESDWTPSSWRSKPMKQEVCYEDQAASIKAVEKLRRVPPIVTPSEIIRLRKQLRDVALGKAFLLQGGDCAELFDYCAQNPIESKIKLLLQMSLVLIYGAYKPVVRIARMAGQYAKPRSSPMEVYDGQEIPSFRGDILNGYQPDDRALDPSRLVSAYFHSAATSNYIRAALDSGVADLHSPLDWDLGHVRDDKIKAEYQHIVRNITDSLRFLRTVGADDNSSQHLKTVSLYTSHEGLLLEYEEPLTRLLKHPPERAELFHTPSLTSPTAPKPKHGYYATSAHFLWIGDRTRQVDGAHVEFVRGLENPIGVKVGPTTSTTDLVALLDTLDPLRQPGKVTLITRYGESQIRALLPAHIDAVRASGHIPVWQCDPMHGNTRTANVPGASAPVKTRQFSAVLGELSAALEIHAERGSYLGGVHLELTGEAVTECVGGAEGLTDEDLSLNYTSYCDPRLNEKQALELAFLVARHLRKETDTAS